MRLKKERRKEKEAAKLKAANTRAAARRIAKESVELIEDEKLELMELAALSMGLPSILALDSETLQNLDLLKGIKIDVPQCYPHLILSILVMVLTYIWKSMKKSFFLYIVVIETSYILLELLQSSLMYLLQGHYFI